MILEDEYHFISGCNCLQFIKRTLFLFIIMTNQLYLFGVRYDCWAERIMIVGLSTLWLLGWAHYDCWDEHMQNDKNTYFNSQGATKVTWPHIFAAPYTEIKMIFLNYNEGIKMPTIHFKQKKPCTWCNQAGLCM